MTNFQPLVIQLILKSFNIKGMRFLFIEKGDKFVYFCRLE